MLNEFKKIDILWGTAFVLIGLLMCIWPGGLTNLMCIIAGIALLIGGSWRIYGYFRKGYFGCEETSFEVRLSLITAAMELALGVVLTVSPRSISNLVPVILGMMAIVNSVFALQDALRFKEIGYKGWWYHAVVVGVCCVAALVMMFNPFKSTVVVSIVMGAAFVIEGILELYTVLFVNEKLKKLGLIKGLEEA